MKNIILLTLTFCFLGCTNPKKNNLKKKTMKQFELPYLGAIDVDNVTKQQEYMGITFQNREITLMWFVEEKIEDIYFQKTKQILDDLEKFDNSNHSLLQTEFINSQNKTVLDYLEYHLEEMPEEFSEIIDDNATKPENLEKLLKALKLNNISFHYGEEIVADYILNSEISDQILAVFVNINGTKRIAWES
jgi:hypothetical protein